MDNDILYLGIPEWISHLGSAQYHNSAAKLERHKAVVAGGKLSSATSNSCGPRVGGIYGGIYKAKRVLSLVGGGAGRRLHSQRNRLWRVSPALARHARVAMRRVARGVEILGGSDEAHKFPLRDGQ
jgi:hypothetical protein